MPLAIRRLDAAEAEQTFKTKTTPVDLTDYVNALADLNVDDSAEVPLNGERPRLVVRRFNQAAEQRGLKLEWKAGEDANTKFFKVVEPKAPGGNRGRGRGRAASNAQATADSTD